MLEDGDHRKLGPRLDLFHFQEEAPGMVFWHPHGWRLYRLVEERVRRAMDRGGYREVRTPQVLARSIWEVSGHWEHFADGMMRLEGARELALKPVSCPGHLQIVAQRVLSYRDLPLRLGELGLCHRNEDSGALHGLFRLRQFTQDDGHIFCEASSIDEELALFCRGLKDFYVDFGFSGFEVAFSTRPPSRAGDDAIWDRAEASLLAAAEAAGLQPVLQPGQGAFYGPKLEFSLRDRLGRAWQCGTIQLDLVLPGRFGVAFVDRSGSREPPVMLHRAILGSLERFIGILLEHHGGVLPGWLAPVQVAVLPIAAQQGAAAHAAVASLRAAGLRAELSASGSTLSRRILDAHADGIPWVAILGQRELERGELRLRQRDGSQHDVPLAQAAELLRAACAEP